MNRKIDWKKIWQQSKPSLKIFGSVTWFLTKLGIVAAIAVLVGGIGTAVGMTMGALRDVPPFDPSLLEEPPLPSYIYDRNGDLITEIHEAEKRVIVKYEDLPQHVIDAFLAAEDQHFFDHPGIDLRGFVRAIYTNLRYGTSQGGSTISQQIAKQAFLTKEKKIRRKIQELYLALNMESQYSKEEILEFYVNNVTFYGNAAYGIEAAAQTYFSKSVTELNLAEAALLAGIPNWPDKYAPDPDNLEPALERRNDVLRRMRRFGFITEEEYQQAIAEELVLNMKEAKGWPFPHYVDAVLHNYAVKALMETGRYETEADAAKAIRRDGLHIYTAMDPRIQQVVQDVMFSDAYYPKDSFVYPEGHSRAGRRYPQGAAVVMDAKTGHVLAAVGGREYNSTNRINRINSGFQPGSAIKPVLVYGPAIEYGLLSPASVLDDAPSIWPDPHRGWFAPENFARTFRGLVTVREAIVTSDNIPAIKAFEMMRYQLNSMAAIDFARKLGLKIPDSSASALSSAIGGSNYLVTPLQMAQAFSAFANKGRVSEPIFVTRIVDRNGEEIYTATPRSEVVMKEETAFLITSMLRDVVTRGTAYPARLSGYNVAAKTGTTDDAHDRWTVGYSRDYVFSVWMGNDNKQVTVDGKTVYVPGLVSNTAYVRLNEMFGAIVKGTIGKNDVPFHPAPNGVTRVTVCNKSGLLPGPHCPSEHIITDWAMRGREPKDVCDLHIPVEICTESGLLASEHCPAHSVEERVFLNRPEFTPTDERWKSGAVGREPADAKLMPPTEYCEVHNPDSVKYTLTVTPTDQGMRLTWNAPRLHNGFNIYRQDFNSSGFIKVNAQPVTGLEFFDNFRPLPGMTYKYQVKIIGADEQETRRHDIVEASLPLSLNLSASAADNKVTLTWNPLNIEIPNGHVAKYKVYRDGKDMAFDRLETQFEDEDVKPGTSYKYQVAAVYNIGGKEYVSRPTAAVSVTLPEAGNGNGNGNGNGDGNGENGENGDGVWFGPFPPVFFL